MSKQPIYALYFRLRGRAVVREFFNPYGDLQRLLTRPPETRDSSFGMGMAAVPQLERAEYWDIHGHELFTGRVRRLRVYADGSVIFRASADESFLCWPQGKTNRVVNPVVVADSIVSFCRFVRELLLMMSVRPETGELGVEIRNAALSVPPLMMYGGKLRKDREFFALEPRDVHGVGEVNPKREVEVRIVDFLAETLANPYAGADAAAYTLVEQFYDIFGLDSSAVPYVDRSWNRPLIDVRAFGR